MAETHKERVTRQREATGERKIARHVRRTDRQERSQERAEQAAMRSTAQQIRVLDARLGAGVGAVKERNRLAAS